MIRRQIDTSTNGSTSLLAVSLIGEYVAKIFEEVKHRPYFPRWSIVKDGEIRDAAEVTQPQ